MASKKINPSRKSNPAAKARKAVPKATTQKPAEKPGASRVRPVPAKPKREAVSGVPRPSRSSTSRPEKVRTPEAKGNTRSSAPARPTPAKAKAAAPAAPPPTGTLTVQWGTKRLELVGQDRPVPKTKLTKKEVREFERMLLEKRSELVGDVENLTHQALSGPQDSGGLSHMPIHMADMGSDNWEQEFTLGLIENERTLVREIDQALERVKNGTYGVCLATHQPIDLTRLRAKPWAKYCIEYARLRELGRVP